MGEPCYSIVRKPKGFETANEFTLKRRIERDDLDKCCSALEELLQNVLDGEKFPANLMMPVINRYQMNKYTGTGGVDKRIKKLLYILWECLPKRGPDGKFLDKLVMVCGAFDRDLKHPNQFVSGCVLRTLSRTREPEVIRELVNSIENSLKKALFDTVYKKKNAMLAVAKIHKDFPDLNLNPAKTISGYLWGSDQECVQAAMQALLEIEPWEADLFIQSRKMSEIHNMDPSVQLLIVEFVQKVFKRGNRYSKQNIEILASLIRSSSSPSVRYKASVALMRFSRDPEAIKTAASCFIDICAKDSDNNVKLIALDSLMDLRRINGAERILRDSIMNILCILQSATDLELHEKILRLSLDLISPLNVGDVVGALKHEMKKMQDTSVLGSQQETVKYRRMLVDTIHQIADRFPNAIVEGEMIDTLFDLLVGNSIGERTCSRLILLFKVFMTHNPTHKGVVIEKVQEYFNQAKDNPSTHRGFLQLLGDFSETKEQIENSYTVIKDSLGELPIVASELRKIQQASAEGSGDNSGTKQSSAANGDVDIVTKGMSRLVTADGSYATQSAINYQSTSSSVENHPPLRAYFLNNKFETASVLCYALLKMACRYQQIESESPVNSNPAEYRKMIARFMFIIASILNLGVNSPLVDSEGNPIHINNDHAENLLLSLNIMQNLLSDDEKEVARLMKKIVIDDMRSQMDSMVKNLKNEAFSTLMSKKPVREPRFDDRITISLFAARDDDLAFKDGQEEEEEERIDKDLNHISMPDMVGEIPLTGTLDPIYAYCEFDVNQYDVGLKIHLENRTKSKTFENVTLELAARGENSSNLIDRPESIVLAPRATACVTTNIKVVSAENRRLFGCIAFEDVASDDREQVIMLNDISVNITDYIKPASINFEDFRDLWRDSEWENKVEVKTKLTNLKEYLMQLVVSTNMRCVTSDRGLSGDCSFLSANLYARSSFGEEALVNVSIEKESPEAVVTGNVKIRSRSQGMALSLGEKITAAQNSSKNN